MTDEDRDVLVVEDERTGSNTGAIVGIIAIIALLVAIWYVALGPGAGSGGSTTNNDNTIDNGGNQPAVSEPAPTSS